jgi:hypothetical protein
VVPAFPTAVVASLFLSSSAGTWVIARLAKFPVQHTGLVNDPALGDRLVCVSVQLLCPFSLMLSTLGLWVSGLQARGVCIVSTGAASALRCTAAASECVTPK